MRCTSRCPARSPPLASPPRNSPLLPRQTPRLRPHSTPLLHLRRLPRLSAEGTDAVQDPVLSPPESTLASLPQSLEWEVDFSSRPLLDERKKKVWELLICDPSGRFQFSQYFPNNKVNSAELKRCIQALLDQEGARPPRRVKFFRGQMKTIISRAFKDLDIPTIPSRRCFALTGALYLPLNTAAMNGTRVAKEATGFSLPTRPTLLS